VIVTGSYAAWLQGHLPPWRNGKTGDIDLVGTPEEMAQVIAITEPLRVQAAPSPGRFWLLSDRQPRIEFETAPLPVFEALRALPDHVAGKAFGLDVELISPTTQYVLKRCARHFFPHMEKHERDIAHFRPMAQLTLLHIELFRLARDDARARFS